MRGRISSIASGIAGLLALPGLACAQGVPPSKALIDGPPAKITVSEDGLAIHVVGRITEDTFGLFLEASRSAPKARVVTLASGGGEMMGGYVMGNLIRLLKLDTHVDHLCASACTLAFGAGKERTLGPWGQLGYHQSYRILPSGDFEAAGDFKVEANFAKLVAGDKRFTFGGGSDSLTVHALKPLGVGDEFLRKVLQTPPQDLWIPDNARLKAEHIVTRVYAEGEALPAPPAPGSQSREAFALSLQQKPFWKALAAVEPAFFATSFLDQWRLVNSGIDGKNAELRARGEADAKVMARVMSAPDEVLDRMAVYLGEASKLGFKYGYPYCSDAPPNAQFEAEALALRESADALFVAALEGAGKVPLPDEGKARSTMQKNYYRLTALGAPPGAEPVDKVLRCQGDEAAVQAIGLLEPKYRAQVLRATLVLGAAERAREAAKPAG